MKKMKASRLRGLIILAVMVIIVAGLVFWTGIGTLSAFSYKSVAAVCPLGSLETMLADKTLLPIPLISLAVMLVIAVFLGRIFCAWICPTAVMRNWFRRRDNGAAAAVAHGKRAAAAGSEKAAAATTVSNAVVETAVTGEAVAAGSVETATAASATAAADEEDDVRRFRPQAAGKPSKIKVDSRHWVLGGALLSTLILGFPVFCLICPIGLTFGTIAAVWRLLDFNEPSWVLLIFPAMLVLELFVFRKWCRRICPLGALLSLVSSLNIFTRPKVDEKTCLRTSQGVECEACKMACFEEIDLHDTEKSQPLSECTKCRDCADACPVQAISFPFFQKKKTGGEKVVSEPAAEEEACQD